MRGYCEQCKREQEGTPDEYGVDVCPDCDGDLVTGFHVIAEYETEEDRGYAAFLNRD